MAVNDSSILPSETTNGTYNAPDADYTIRLRDAPHLRVGFERFVLFKAHKARLAAASSVFRKLFETHKDDDESEMLRVDGDSRVWELLLHSIYNKSDMIRPLSSFNVETVLEIWKEALQYDLLTLYLYAEESLIWRLSTSHFTMALGIYAEALTRKRPALAKAALSRAKEGRLRDFPVACLAKVDSVKMAEFVKMLYERDCTELRDVGMQLVVAESLSNQANVKEHLKSAKRKLSKVTQERNVVRPVTFPGGTVVGDVRYCVPLADSEDE